MICVSSMAAGAEARSAAARAEFVRSAPCPATGSPKPRHACPGFVVDHIVPLCAGGADRPENMQWQPIEEARRKDQDERKACRRLRAMRREL